MHKFNSVIKNNTIKDNNTNLYWGGGIMCESFQGIISDNVIIK